MRIKPDLTLPSALPKSSTVPAMTSIDVVPHQHTVQADVHNDLSPGSTIGPVMSAMTDSGVVNDPFADDADDILSKHQSLIVGSMEDLFSMAGSNVRDYVIHEEESSSNSGRSTQEKRHVVAPTPPPRPRSRCLSECSLYNDSKSSTYAEQLYGGDGGGDSSGPPPLPPKQYKGSRRRYKPLPAEPPEASYEEDSSDKNTDSESIKQEINALTSQIADMAYVSSHQ